MEKKMLLIFPHQLLEKHPGLRHNPELIVLLEDSLFFGDDLHPARFHKQKLWLLRASMKRYAFALAKQGHEVVYLDHESCSAGLAASLAGLLKAAAANRAAFSVADPVDFLLEKRLKRATKQLGCELTVLPTPSFINEKQDNQNYRGGQKRWFMADFYKWQRQRLDILMDGEQPLGGKWSFDEENRKKVPAKLVGSSPPLPVLRRDEFDLEAVAYVNSRFGDHPGSLENLYYPTSHASARRWLRDFLENRFAKFGDYEDAIVEGQSWLWHSLLTPALNIGLLTPEEVVHTTLQFMGEHEVPLNSVEGFLRQIIGWREFMRATYEDLGVRMRTTNHWSHHRQIPACFYDGTTGITPIDDTIQRILNTGYCHHIERLMVLGGFMFLCEFDPDEIYLWFMEMFVDSYDWVMVPNVYAMSQNADGGLITTKPYFSGSAYVRKMSNYKTGKWCKVWDGLYWRWIWNHSKELSKNPRWAMMCAMASKMEANKRHQHIQLAEDYLKSLDSGRAMARK